MKNIFTSILFISLLVSQIHADLFNFFEKDNSKELYLKYTQYPKNIYTQQRFSVKLEAIILTNEDDYDAIVTTYSDEQNIDLLDNNITWVKSKDHTYTTKITYKARKGVLKLPILTLLLLKDTTIVKSISINPPKIHYSNIALNQKRFSNIIAQNLDIKSIKSKQYTNNMLLVVINLATTNGNLEEFYLKQFQEQSIESFKELDHKQEMYYSVIVPKHIQSIYFDYYNPKIKQFITVELPIILDEELVSTQTDLNPYNNNMLLYKQIFISIILCILILLYWKTKNKIIFILIVLSSLFLIKVFIPNSRIILPKDTKIYILPTSSSTIYKIVQKKSEVEVLIKKDKFIKVLFKNKNIGWVKKDDIK